MEYAYIFPSEDFLVIFVDIRRYLHILSHPGSAAMYFISGGISKTAAVSWTPLVFMAGLPPGRVRHVLRDLRQPGWKKRIKAAGYAL